MLSLRLARHVWLTCLVYQWLPSMLLYMTCLAEGPQSPHRIRS